MIAVQVGSLLDQRLLCKTHERLVQFSPHRNLIRYTVSSLNCGVCRFMLDDKTEHIANSSRQELQERESNRLNTNNLGYYSPQMHIGFTIISFIFKVFMTINAIGDMPYPF